MSHKFTNYIGLIIISLSIISCADTPSSKTDCSQEAYKLYFYALSEQDNGQDTNSFFIKYKNFYINDSSIIENIKKKVIKEKSNVNRTYSFLYVLKFVKNEEIIDGGILDVVNGEILYHNGKYKFDLEVFAKLNNSFKTLNSYSVNCITISNTKRFFNFVQNSNGFIYNKSKDEKNPLKKFKGVVYLRTDTSNVDFMKEFEEYQIRFISDFKELGDILILQSSVDEDSINLTMLWESDYTLNLPKRYRITKQFTDTFDLPLQIYDIEKEEILFFFKENNIEEYTITDLNK